MSTVHSLLVTPRFRGPRQRYHITPALHVVWWNGATLEYLDITSRDVTKEEDCPNHRPCTVNVDVPHGTWGRCYTIPIAVVVYVHELQCISGS